MGYSTEFLIEGGGGYQMFGDTRHIPWCFTPSICDDPRDTYYIRKGAIIYDNEH